jgi:CheY-like chemotaxis protein/anti-sigma regulatory factor (Ser/Thr protein kinase)
VLHDHLQQLLVGARYGLEGLRASSKAKTVREKANRVDRMLESCLEASRSLTAELSPPVLRDTDLTGALAWLASWFDEKQGLAVELDAARCPIDAEEVRVSLFQAARELLFNVVKHAGVARARVRVTRSRDGLVRVTVSDDGVGFDPGAVGRGPAAGAPGAPGLGLFGIRERLSLLGGRLDVKSGPGKGSQFTLVVPTRKARASRRPGALRTASGGPGDRTEAAGRRPGRARRSIKVLVADDHRVVREGLAKLLEGQADISLAGVAADGREAVDLARGLHPDVVIMDIGMPSMNGIEATRLVKAALPGVRVIGLSMHTEASQVSAMLEAGADVCLDKAGPFDALLASIRAG